MSSTKDFKGTQAPHAPILETVDSSTTSGINTTHEETDHTDHFKSSTSRDPNDRNVVPGSEPTIVVDYTDLKAIGKQMADLTCEVRNMVLAFGNMAKANSQAAAIDTSTSKTESGPVQSTPDPHTYPTSTQFQDTSNIRGSLGSQVLLQPSALYDGTSYNHYAGPDGIMVKGYEATCNYINDIRRRFTDSQRVDELPYIQKPSPDVEKAFIENYVALSSKLDRTPNDERILKRYDALKFPTIKGKGPDSFHYWMKRLVWYKHTYFIPDYLIRDTILEVAQSLTDPGLASVVRASCKKVKNAQSSPIRYDVIFNQWDRRIAEEVDDDIIGAISDVIRLGISPKSVLSTIRVELDAYLGTNGITDLPLLIWVRFFKMLFDDLEEVMDQIVRYMKPVIKVIKPSENGKQPVVELDGIEIKAHLESIKQGSQKQILATKMTVTYGEVWEAVSTTFAERSSHIHLRNKQTKTDNRQKIRCSVCGKNSHDTTSCYVGQRAVTEGSVVLRNGTFFTAAGKELKVNDSETLVKKYLNLFKDKARQRTPEEKN